MDEVVVSIGMHRVGWNFNPTQNIKVDEVKGHTAWLIDSMETLKEELVANPEALRCAAIAQTKFEEAAMWAVKAITKPPREGT